MQPPLPPLPPFPKFVVSRNCEKILTPAACLLGGAVTLLVDLYCTCTHYNEGDCPYCIPPLTNVGEWGITVIAAKSGCWAQHGCIFRALHCYTLAERAMQRLLWVTVLTSSCYLAIMADNLADKVDKCLLIRVVMYCLCTIGSTNVCYTE